jgi:SAM-dependent methyltransferase
MAGCPVCAAPLPATGIVAPDRWQGTPGTFTVVTCPECGSGVTLPQASAQQLAAFYPAGYGPHADGVESGLLALISRAIRRIQGELAWRRPPLDALAAAGALGRGLDVGAGRGDLSAALSRRGARITAIEPGQGAVAQLRSRGIDAHLGTLATVELERGAFDFAIFQHSLEHTSDPLGDLRRVHAALRPGGLVLISVPNFGSWQRRAFAGAWYQLDVPRHRVHFGARALERALRDSGFGGVRLSCSSSPVGLPASIQYMLAGRCLFPQGLPFRIATGLCALSVPLTWALDRVAGEGDTLHAVASRDR